jgi:hypothetical protein
MYCQIFERVCRELFGERQFEKDGGEKVGGEPS